MVGTILLLVHYCVWLENIILQFALHAHGHAKNFELFSGASWEASAWYLLPRVIFIVSAGTPPKVSWPKTYSWMTFSGCSKATKMEHANQSDLSSCFAMELVRQKICR